ncbi:glycosyltransferase family 4 protein [Candidatus Saccharibacteria bacterium]|nr:glycosyltransferase family 4 protein [Candidatus Saccharibacteria bacterium]MBP7834866.1 glycosyltransferase family 4 protein [Candidatus Saccharibacteria bacterium]
MRVLMLGWELPPHNSGGLGVACYHLCKALSKKNVDIEFIVPYSDCHDDIDFMKVNPAIPQSAEKVQKSGIAYDSFKYFYDDGSEQDISLFQQVSNYADRVEQMAILGDYDIIHAHDWLTFRAGLRAKELSGKPLILHVHATEFDRAGGKPGNPMVHEIEYMGFLIADRIIAVSQHTKNIIVKEYGVPEDKIEVVHNSIDISVYSNISSDNAYKYLVKMKSQGYRVVSNVGRLTVQKNLYNLIQAAKLVIERTPKTLFLIVGSGEQYLELLELAAELGISKNVIFTDFQRGKNLRDAFSVADLFVMPSVSEPFGLTPLEAIGYGTPALVSKQSGVAEVITNCLKVDFWDIKEMANQISAVVRNDSLRDELHSQSYKEFLKLSWDDAAHKMVGTYHQHAQLVGTR